MGLRRKDIKFAHRMMIVRFRRTKTNQFGKRRLKIPIVANGTSICPVAMCKRMVELVPGHHREPLFFIPNNNSITPLSKRTFLSHVRHMLVRAGCANATRFTCPSFRRGGASWAFRNGVLGELIQIYGDRPVIVTNYIWKFLWLLSCILLIRLRQRYDI